MNGYIGFMYIYTHPYIISNVLRANDVQDTVHIVISFLIFTITIQSKEN